MFEVVEVVEEVRSMLGRSSGMAFDLWMRGGRILVEAAADCWD